jgi:hypothetical protein
MLSTEQAEPLGDDAQDVSAIRRAGTPDAIKFTLTRAQAGRVGEAGIRLLPESSSVKPRAALREWKSYETPNLVYPAAFTYKTTADVSTEGQKVILAALRADEFLKERGLEYKVDLKILTTEAEVKAATLAVYDISGFGNFESAPLGPKMLRVFENQTKRTLYGGLITVKVSDAISYEATVVVILDHEYSEISAIAGGEMFDAFIESSEE